MANEFIARKGLIALQDSQITGSLDITEDITATKTGSFGRIEIDDTIQAANFTGSFMRLDQNGNGFRMTNRGAFDADGTDFRVFATNNNLKLATNGSSGTRLTLGSNANGGANFTTNITSSGNISASGNVYANELHGDGSNITNLPAAAITSYTNPGINRLITSVNSSTVDGEPNLTFNGSLLDVTGNISASNTIGSVSASIDRVLVNDTLQGNGSGFQFFAFNEDTIKVKFANWYSSTDRQYGQGQLWYETWFAAIDNQSGRDNRRIGFYLEEPDAGATDADNGTGKHPSNARFYVDITGSYVASGGLHVTDADFNVESDGNVEVNGNISITGTVDGVDVASLKSDFDTLEGKTLFSGSSQVNADSITNFDTNVKDKLNADNIVSASGAFVNNEFIVAVGTNAITSSDALAVDSNGNLGIGTASPDVRLHMVGQDAQTSQILMEQYNNTSDAPDIRTRRYRTASNGDPADVIAGDYLFRLNVHGQDDGSSALYGSMRFDVDGTNQNALEWAIQTRDTSGNNPTDRIKIDSSGDVDIAGQLSINGFSDVSASLAAAVAGGDNLGNHTATQDLNMGGNAITSVGNVDGVDISTFKSRFDTLEGKSLLSGSAQIASDISGAFTAGNGISLSSGQFSVAAGTGLNQGATGLSFDADGGTLTTNNNDVDHILINDGGVFKRITKGNINVGDFNNDVNYLTSAPAGTVSSSAQFTSTDDVEFRNITASGEISSSNVEAGAYILEGNILGAMTGGTTIAFGFQNSTPILIGKSGNPTKIAGHVTASGNISASGNIYATEFHGDGSNLTGLSIDISSDTNLAGGTNLTLSGDTMNLDNDITLEASGHRQLKLAATSFGSASIILQGNSTAGANKIDAINKNLELQIEGTTVAEVESTGIDITGNITASGNISASGDIYLTGDVQADGSLILVGGSSTSRIGFSPFGSITDQFISGFGNQITIDGDNYIELIADNEVKINAPKLGIGTIYSVDNASQVPEALTVTGNISASGDLNITSNITSSGNISASGNIYATEFHGDGSNLTGISGGGGAVSAVANGADDRIATFSSTDALNGESALTFDGTKLEINPASATANAILFEVSVNGDQRAFIDEDGDATFDGYVTAYGLRMSNDGAQSSPALAFGTDVNTGIYQPANDQIAIQAGGGTAEINVSTAGVNINNGDLGVNQTIEHIGDTDTKIDFTTNNISLEAGGTQGLELDITGSTLPNVKYNIYDTASAELGAAGGAIGDIVKFGGTTTSAGFLYFLNQTGTWTATNASGTSASTGSLAVALGTNSTTDGMLLRGMANLSSGTGGAGNGQPVYLSTAGGRVQSSAPSTAGNVSRIVGHVMNDSNNLIYFNPSNDWIVID